MLDAINNNTSQVFNDEYMQKMESLKYQSPQEKIINKFNVDNINKNIKNGEGKPLVKDLGKEEFLKLLITELQHQDPTNPMQDREFIAQMAQFSSLEQMLNFNKGLSKLIENVSFQSSFNLLGLNVEIESPESVDQNGNLLKVQGIVESVTKNNDEVFVRVNGETYPASSIVNVRK